MARGFESKSVANQQELADAPFPGRRPEVDPMLLAQRRKLELGLADIKRRLVSAQQGGHREMLRRAEMALEKDLKALG